jgi:hypothetical protein
MGGAVCQGGAPAPIECVEAKPVAIPLIAAYGQQKMSNNHFYVDLMLVIVLWLVFMFMFSFILYTFLPLQLQSAIDSYFRAILKRVVTRLNVKNGDATGR